MSTDRIRIKIPTMYASRRQYSEPVFSPYSRLRCPIWITMAGSLVRWSCLLLTECVAHDLMPRCVSFHSCSRSAEMRP